MIFTAPSNWHNVDQYISVRNNENDFASSFSIEHFTSVLPASAYVDSYFVLTFPQQSIHLMNRGMTFSWLQCLMEQLSWTEHYFWLQQMRVVHSPRHLSTLQLLKSCVFNILSFCKTRLILSRKVQQWTSMKQSRNLYRSVLLLSSIGASILCNSVVTIIFLCSGNNSSRCSCGANICAAEVQYWCYMWIHCEKDPHPREEFHLSTQHDCYSFFWCEQTWFRGWWNQGWSSRWQYPQGMQFLMWKYHHPSEIYVCAC